MINVTVVDVRMKHDKTSVVKYSSCMPWQNYLTFTMVASTTFISLYLCMRNFKIHGL